MREAGDGAEENNGYGFRFLKSHSTRNLANYTQSARPQEPCTGLYRKVIDYPKRCLQLRMAPIYWK